MIRFWELFTLSSTLHIWGIMFTFLWKVPLNLSMRRTQKICHFWNWRDFSSPYRLKESLKTTIFNSSKIMQIVCPSKVKSYVYGSNDAIVRSFRWIIARKCQNMTRKGNSIWNFNEKKRKIASSWTIKASENRDNFKTSRFFPSIHSYMLFSL